jgi:hypothetical protein
MKLALHYCIVLTALLFGNIIHGQTVILDFESPETTTTFQYFGSTLDGSLSEVITNPDPSGINPSNNVLRFVKPANSQVWAGAFTNPDPQTNVDFIANNKVCMKVWMPRPGGVSLKLENSLNGAPNWILTANSTVANQWVELCFDASLPSEEAPFNVAAGDVYTRLVVFTYFGTNSPNEEVVFIDDIIAVPGEIQTTVVLDFEAPETTTNFQYFGSPLDGQSTMVITNPDKSGINTSDNVLEYVKGASSQVWAGAFSNPNPSRPVDLTGGGQICVKVWSPNVGNLALKLEASSTGADWILTQPIEKANEWVEICYSAAAASLEAPFLPASGHLYQRIVIFFDFGTATGAQPVTYYLDDLVVNSVGSGSNNVTFSVNISELGNITQDVFLIGNFNDFQPSTPMNNVGNGVYEVTLPLGNGVYQYKYMIGANGTEESFGGLEECTVTSADGQFTNRRLVVSAETVLNTVCFNSCYNCGDGVLITINLGLGPNEPAESGVYVAGGQAFDAPGGRYRMQDTGQNNVFTITFERGKGFSSFYTFANGACPDYSCKEDIAGQDCANPGNFNDRLIPPTETNLVINTCFGVCSNNLDCGTLSTAEFSLGKLFTIYPTLVNERLIISSDNSIDQNAMLTITNLQGQIISHSSAWILQGENSLSLNDIPPGTYLLNITTGRHREVHKFIKLK